MRVTIAIEELTGRLNDQIAQLREMLRQSQSSGYKYLNAETYSEAFPHSEDFYKTIGEGNAVREKIVPLAIELFELKVAGTRSGARRTRAFAIQRDGISLPEATNIREPIDLPRQLVVNNPDNASCQGLSGKIRIAQQRLSVRRSKRSSTNTGTFLMTTKK